LPDGKLTARTITANSAEESPKTYPPQIAKDRTPSAVGSPYVPLYSWIYPVLDRLATLGLFDYAILGLKPWTRLECARLVSEAGDRLRDAGSETEAARLYDSLRPEFSSELSLLRGEATILALNPFTRVPRKFQARR
jgi:hypothetical protein